MSGLSLIRLNLSDLMIDPRKILGRNIDLLSERKTAGYSKTGLALHCGVEQSVVSKWCRGGTMPLKYLGKIAQYLDVQLKDLFSEDDFDSQKRHAKKREPSPEEALKILTKFVRSQRMRGPKKMGE